MANPRPTLRRIFPGQRRSLAASESGNALLELALTLPLFLILIVGGAEIANLAWASVQVNNAARAAAAYGSISRTTAADITNIALAAQNEAPKLITSASQVQSTQLCSCVGSDGSPTPIPCDQNALSACSPSSGTIQVAVKVSTQAAVTPIVHYPGLPATYTVHGQATVGVLQ